MMTHQNFSEMTSKINCFIISYNRLTHLKRVVEFLQQEPELRIIIADNNSTYKPLIEYLRSMPENDNMLVWKLPKNYGHTVLWDVKFTEFYSNRTPYIVTDCDVLPESKDWLKILKEGLRIFTSANKIGLGLRIDDIPDHNKLKNEIVKHESGLFKYPTPDKRFVESPVDTTLAIYRAGYHNYSVFGAENGETQGRCKALRTTTELARHLPWYMTEEELKSEEHQHYIKSLKEGSTHWSTLQK